ncbi:MAG: hypothetical protein ACTHM5_10990 [Ginsengibacter sp.]
MKNLFLSVLFVHLVVSSKSQDTCLTKNIPSIDLSFIKNQKIKYSIVLMSCDTCVPIRNIGYRVIVELNKKHNSIVKKISKESWLKLLNNNCTDFAANLLLYSMYNKDALILSKNDSIESWRKYLKEDDLVYWSKHLKK